MRRRVTARAYPSRVLLDDHQYAYLRTLVGSRTMPDRAPTITAIVGALAVHPSLAPRSRRAFIGKRLATTLGRELPIQVYERVERAVGRSVD